MVLAGATSVVRLKQAARHVHLKLILGAAHGDVEKPTFLLDLRDTAMRDSSFSPRLPSS
jgi:hypothetical protein